MKTKLKLVRLNSKLTLLLLLILSFWSCRKEEAIPKISKNNSISESGLTKRVKSKILQKNIEINDEEFIEKAKPLREKLINNKKLSYNKSEDSLILLEDFFIIHQGTVNSIHVTQFDPDDEIEEFIYEVDIPVVNLGVDSFGIEINDYNQFYTDLTQNINAQVSFENGEYLVVSKWELVSINSSIATVKIGLVIAQAATYPISLVPSAPYYAVGKFGHCSNPPTVPQGFDASDVIEHYLHRASDFNTQCNQGQTRYLVYLGKLLTKNPPTHNSISVNDVTSKLYYSSGVTIVDCIGNANDPVLNDAIWNNYFQDAHNLASQAGVSYNLSSVVWICMFF